MWYNEAREEEVLILYLSNRTNQFLNAIVCEFRSRCRHGNGLDIFFSFQYRELKRFRKFSKAEAEMCIWELAENGLIRRYQDGGFAIIPKTIAFYDEKHRRPYIRVFWFVAGAIFTAALDFAVILLNKLTECV